MNSKNIRVAKSGKYSGKVNTKRNPKQVNLKNKEAGK